MFDIGFWELVILFGLGLLVLGPDRLPRVAMQLGNWAGQARRMARTLTTQIRDELDIDVNRPFESSRQATPTTYHRPGVDDLKPGSDADRTDVATDTDSGTDTGAEPATDPGRDGQT